MRKFDAIDLMKLYSMGSNNGWNEELTRLCKARDINGLAKLRYRIQAGMDDLVKLRLNSPEMNNWFLRLNRSIEITAKRAIKGLHPLPQDFPLIAKDPKFVSTIEQKKKRDIALADFMRDSAY